MGKIDWKEIHRFQEEPGWCGPAVIQMALLAGKINLSQSEIARSVYQDWWGTAPDMMLAYLSRFFKEIDFKAGSTLDDIANYLQGDRVVIIDWWDDLDGEEPDGHYSIGAELNLKSNRITLADPSRARSGVWEMAADQFERKWYDFLDFNRRRKNERWLLWLDPSSKI